MNLHPLLSAAYRRRFVVILLLVAVMNFADRAVFSVLSPLIRAELHLTDTQIGLLQGLSFALLYGGLGIPIGRLAERHSRVRIIAIATAIWSAATAFSGMAGNYLQMALARVSRRHGRGRVHRAHQFTGGGSLSARAPRLRHVADHAGPAVGFDAGRDHCGPDRAALGLARGLLRLRRSRECSSPC